MGPPPATPAPSRFLISKKPSTQQQQSQTPNQTFRGSSQFHATPRFAASTPRPSSTQTGAPFATPALVVNSRVPRNRSTQDIIDDSSPIDPEDGSPSGSPTNHNALPEPIEIDSSLVPRSSFSPEEPGEGRPPKRRRISIASSEPEGDPLVISQHSQDSDLGSLPDAPDDRIISYYSDVDDDNDDDDEEEPEADEDDGPDISSTQSNPSSPAHPHFRTAGDLEESELDDPEDDAEAAADPETVPKRTDTKPTFRRAGPRFKLAEPPDRFAPHPDAYLSADIFSPQRRGAKYLPGGLAAELRDWLVDVKGGVDGEGEVKATSSALGFGAAADAAAKVVVGEVARGGPGMTLVFGRVVDGGDVEVRVILAGEGNIEGLGGGGGRGMGIRLSLGLWLLLRHLLGIFSWMDNGQWLIAGRW